MQSTDKLMYIQRKIIHKIDFKKTIIANLVTLIIFVIIKYTKKKLKEKNF